MLDHKIVISKHENINYKFQGNYLWLVMFQAQGQAAGNDLLLSYRVRKGEAGDTVRPLVLSCHPGSSSIPHCKKAESISMRLA